jgi:clan AA aspartic protease
MRLAYADLTLINFADETLFKYRYLPKDKIRLLNISALADTGAIRLTINEHIKHKLGLRIRSSINVTLADGSKRNVQVAGPIRVKFKKRDCITNAFVQPNNEEPLLGAIPMELMDLTVIPSAQKVEYNPSHPDGPIFSLK